MQLETFTKALADQTRLRILLLLIVNGWQGRNGKVGCACLAHNDFMKVFICHFIYSTNRI